MGQVKIYGLIAAGVAVLALIAAAVFFKLRLDAAEAKLETARQQLAVAEKAAADNAFALAVSQAQQQGGEAVAEQVFRRLADQQAFAKVQQQRIANAPVTERNNSVVPGVVADFYDELQRRRSAGAGPQAGGPSGAPGGAQGGLPAGAPVAAPQRVPPERRSPARRGAGGADRPRRPVPDRGRRMEGVGRLHADPAVRSEGGVSDAGPGARPAGARGLIAAAAVAVLIAGPAAAQEHHHPLHRDFYRHWKQPGTETSCCDARVEVDGVERGDCEPVGAEPRRGADGQAHWFAWLRQESRWLEIPDERVIRERNPGGQDGHLCWTPARGVLCFVPPDTGG